MRSSRELVSELRAAFNQGWRHAALVVRFAEGDKYLRFGFEALALAQLNEMMDAGGRPVAIATAWRTDTGKIEARCIVETVADDDLQKELPEIARKFGILVGSGRMG
jgi:hypothetical protein